MAILITHDDIDDFPLTPCGQQPSAADWRERAAQYEAWATDDSAFELDGEVTAAYLLICAAGDYTVAGEYADGMRCAKLAAEHSSAAPFQAHPVLIELNIAAGSDEAADALADEVRRARVHDPDVLEMIAAAFEIGGRYERAQRWYSIAVRNLDAKGDDGSQYYESALSGRYRVRRELDLPHDVLDDDCNRLRVLHGHRPL